MYRTFLSLLILSSAWLWAGLSYSDLKAQVEAGTPSETILKNIHDHGLSFEVDRGLLRQMKRDDMPAWLIDTLIDFDAVLLHKTYADEDEEDVALYSRGRYRVYGSYYGSRFAPRFWDEFFYGPYSYYYSPFALWPLYWCYPWYNIGYLGRGYYYGSPYYPYYGGRGSFARRDAGGRVSPTGFRSNGERETGRAVRKPGTPPKARRSARSGDAKAVGAQDGPRRTRAWRAPSRSSGSKATRSRSAPSRPSASRSSGSRGRSAVRSSGRSHSSSKSTGRRSARRN